MQPLFEHRARFGGFQTRILELEGEGPPFVFLHGYADSADTWRNVLVRLGRSDRRALAVDMPGFGTADLLRDGAILPQLDRFAAGVVERAAAEGDEVIVCGNSLGGCVSLRLAQRADLPLAGVVPIAPAGLDMARWISIVERDPILRTLLSLPAPLPEALVREAVGRVYRTLAFHRQRDIDGKVVSLFTGHHRDRATVARYLETARRLLPELKDPFALSAIECPLLVVWGDRDRMVAPSGAQRVLEALPETEVELIEGCGHCPQIEEADRVVELLLEFPRELRRAA
ncbi:MAG TPA: alpha/beta fold hydrolase [Solirubrobacteraceae bacterium]